LLSDFGQEIVYFGWGEFCSAVDDSPKSIYK